MGSKMKFSMTFHPQTDGHIERTTQVLEDMLRACDLDFKVSWSKYLPLAEFAYNNSYQATIRMDPYEALYGQGCQLPITGHEADKTKIPDLEPMARHNSLRTSLRP